MTRRSVLIVDADAASAKLLSVVLGGAGWLAIVAHSVDAGRRVLDLLRVDAVLFEPGPQADVALAHLHALRGVGRSRVPIVLVSANNDELIRDPACAGHIRKPIDVASFPDQLVLILEPTP